MDFPSLIENDVVAGEKDDTKDIYYLTLPDGRTIEFVHLEFLEITFIEFLTQVNPPAIGKAPLMTTSYKEYQFMPVNGENIVIRGYSNGPVTVDTYFTSAGKYDNPNYTQRLEDDFAFFLVTDENGNTEQRTADDAFQIIGSLGNGATVTLELISAARQTEHTWRLEIYGTEGTLVMLDDNKVLLSEGSAALEEVELAADLEAPSTMPPVAARYYNGFQRALDALHETLLSGTKHPYLADFGHGHSTQKVLDAVRTSAREGRKVEVN